jgi:hypothetical protein
MRVAVNYRWADILLLKFRRAEFKIGIETKVTAAAAIVVCALIGAPASAQDDIVPIVPGGIENYCYYANKLYSVGSVICISVIAGPTPKALVCRSKDNDKDSTKTGRAVWQLADTIICR